MVNLAVLVMDDERFAARTLPVDLLDEARAARRVGDGHADAEGGLGLEVRQLQQRLQAVSPDFAVVEPDDGVVRCIVPCGAAMLRAVSCGLCGNAACL